MDLQLTGNAAGGIGLFLLGMMLMTDGLKMAAGRALRNILTEGTRTPFRGLMSGVFITSLVQSSSAVTVATIGFVNAGLLDLLQTVYVIFGSNIGTTMTSWLVALVGFQVNVKAFALPLIAIGMAMRVTGGNGRRGAAGLAMAGFGLFFLGIDILKETFSDLGASLPIEQFAREGMLGVAIFVGIGFILTFLMQSSSAAMAIILTATAGGVVPMESAAASVIGANVGTTSTAALAVIGATDNAKRAAAAHVVFNLLTGVVAMLLLTPVLLFIAWFSDSFGLDQSPVMTLALFHTFFNILGVALMWPLTRRLVTFLETRFVRISDDGSAPRYLDKNIVATPSLAMDALMQELKRVAELARGMACSVLSVETQSDSQMESEQKVLTRLADAIRHYTVEVQRAGLSQDVVEMLPELIRVARYYEDVAEQVVHVSEQQKQILTIEDEELNDFINHFRSEAVKLIKQCDPYAPEYDKEKLDERLLEMQRRYQDLKAHLLRAGARDKIPVRQMVVNLDQYSDIRRMLEQSVKGATYLGRANNTMEQLKQDVPQISDESA